MFIPFGPFAPDQDPLGFQGASVAKNCVPITSRSYGPFPQLSAITGALTARCQGAQAFRASDGSVHVFAGDATKLYKLVSGGTTWSDVSKAAGYTTAADDTWYFIQLGDRIIATNYTDAIQTYVIGSSTLFEDLSADAPLARFIAVIRGFVVAADTNDPVDGYQQSRVWWAAYGDPTSWPTPGSAAAAAAQSDYQDISFGGAVNGLLGGVGGNDGVVWLQNAIVRMNYTPGSIFDFQDAERGRGTTVPGGLVNAGSLGAFYVAEDGPYRFDGVRSAPLGFEQTDRFLWDNINQQLLPRVRSAINPKLKLWFLAVPTTSSSGNPDRILIYNWDLRRWAYAEQDVQTILTGYTAGYTLEELDAIGTLEALPFSLDSAAWQGGRVLQAGFDASNQFGFFDGANLEAALETGEFLDQEGDRVVITGIKAITDAATVTASVGYREGQDDTVTYATATSPALDGFCPQLVDTPYPRARVVIAASQTWTHAQGIIPMVEGTSGPV